VVVKGRDNAMLREAVRQVVRRSQPRHSVGQHDLNNR